VSPANSGYENAAKLNGFGCARWNERVPTQDTQRGVEVETLLRVAAVAFRRNGYHGTSLVDIATDLGISKPTLYYYTPNKPDLFYQCHLAAADQAIESICEDAGLTGLERLKATLIGYIETIRGRDLSLLDRTSIEAATPLVVTTAHNA
jgi:AcrR family transcriptional regulator